MMAPAVSVVDGKLQCAHCGNTGDMHQTQVQVCEREEDAEQGLHVTVSRGACQVESDVKGAPGRRQSVEILFRCACTKHTWVGFVQDRGATLVITKAAK